MIQLLYLKSNTYLLIYYYYFFMCVQKPVKRVFANSLKSQLKTFFPPLNFHCLIILFSSPLSFLEQQVSFSSFSPLFFAAAIFAASKLFLEMTRNHHQIADTMTSLRGEGGRFCGVESHSVAKCEIMLGFNHNFGFTIFNSEDFCQFVGKHDSFL